MDPKVSIIIPIYNAEKLLPRLLRSIQNQYMTHFEALLINDGSTDGSTEICNNICEEDKRFKVVHKKNAGVAAARQTGLEMAKGTYVIHADADDWMDDNMLSNLCYEADVRNADIVIADYYVNIGDEQNIIKQQPSSLQPCTVLHELFQQLHGSCCNKLVRRACYNKYGAKFFPGINYCEDLLFWIQILQHEDVNIYYHPRAYYHYYCDLSHQSITGSYNRNLFDTICKVVSKIEEILPKEKWQPEIDRFKLSVKYGAFEHPIFSWREYMGIYPEVNWMILSFPTSLLNRTLFFLSYLGFYRIATRLYKIKNDFRGNKVR